MKKLLLFLLILPVLVGCATQAQRQAEQMEEQLKIATQAMTACMKSVRDSAPGNRLNKRFVFRADDPKTVEKLIIDGYVTEQEINDFLEYAALRKSCNTLANKELGKAHTEYGILGTKFSAEGDAEIVDVIKKKITVAEYNQRTLDSISRANEEFSQIQRRIHSQFNQSHQQEIAQRQRSAQAAAQAQQQWNYQQQILTNQQQALDNQRLNESLNALGQPIRQRTTTDCNYTGNKIHCTHN